MGNTVPDDSLFTANSIRFYNHIYLNITSIYLCCSLEMHPGINFFLTYSFSYICSVHLMLTELLTLFLYCVFSLFVVICAGLSVYLFKLIPPCPHRLLSIWCVNPCVAVQPVTLWDDPYAWTVIWRHVQWILNTKPWPPKYVATWVIT